MSHPNRLPVTVALLTLNEEKSIARCLASVAWADEILLVDGGSSDRTLEIARDSKAPWAKSLQVRQRAWTGFRDQRNFCLEHASHDWILVIDADEECSPELRTRLEGLLSMEKGPPFLAYKVRRVEYFLGKAIHHGIWNPSYQDRFYHRGGVRYVNEVHEYPVFPSAPQMIHEPLLHWPDFHPEKFLEKMNKYTTIEARERVKSGQRTHVFRILFAFPAMFLKNYFYYGAYKDGMHGFVISILEGISRAVRHVKIWQFSRANEALPR